MGLITLALESETAIMAAWQRVRVLAGACIALGLVVTACGGGSSDDSADTTASAGEPAGIQTAPTESPLPDDSAPAPSVPDIVAAQWGGFCALDPSLRFGLDPAAWHEHTGEIEEALAAGGEELSNDAKELLEGLTTLENSHRALSDAIEAAKADQSVVDCTTGTCDVLVSDSGVLLLDEDAFRYESGNIIPLPVEEELRAVQDATRALAVTADGLGLDACDMLTGEQATGPGPEPTSPAATEAASPRPGGFEEQFDGGLEDGWRWSLEDPGTWSLVAAPGWLQITAVEFLQNVLLRPAPDVAYEVTAAVSFRPTSNFQFAGLVATPRGGQTVTLLQLGRAYCDPLDVPDFCVGDGVYFDKIEDGEIVNSIVGEISTDTDVLHLRLLVDGDSYSGYFSEDGEIWTLVGDQVASYIDTDIGLIAHQANEEPATALFDYLTVTSPPAGPEPTSNAPVGEDYEECRAVNAPLIGALDALHRDLDGGISFDDYTMHIQSLSAAVDQSLLPREMWETGCRYDVNDQLARAWKTHLNLWGVWDACLQDEFCDTASIDAAIEWEQAEELFFVAVDALQAMQPE